MTFKELCKNVAEASGESVSKVEEVLKASFEQIVGGVVKGEEVNLPSFGKFVSRVRPSHKGRNPSTGETIEIPERKAIVFRPASNFKDQVK